MGRRSIRIDTTRPPPHWYRWRGLPAVRSRCREAPQGRCSWLMNGDRVVLVGIAWTLLLLVLLVTRELLRSSDRPRAARSLTVINLLTAVESGRVDAGIVYRTDAMSARVRVIANVPAKDHPYLDIVYPAAVIPGPSEAEARRFLQFLKSPAARAVFDKRGFGRP